MMKKIYISLFIFVSSTFLMSQNVGISDLVFTPDASAMLEVKATNKGILIPRIALTQTTSASPVTSPAQSLLVYNTATINDVTPGYYYWDGSKWVRLLSEKAWLLSGNNIGASDFLGTTNNMDLKIYTNNSEKMRVTSTGRIGINTSSPSYRLHVNGSTKIDTFLLVGNPTATATTRRGCKTFYMTSTLSVQNGYVNSASLGTLDLPPGATSITVTKVVYAINGYHEDGNEQHGAMVRIGTTDFGSVYETSFDGYTPVDWTNTSTHATSFTSSQNVYLRIYDDADPWPATDNSFYVLNAVITIYYEYTIAPQRGDILAEGNVYSRSIYSTGLYGDLAEHYAVVAPANETIEAGKIVSFIPGSEATFTLATTDNINHIAGVISANPTVLLNNPSEGYPIAMVGRVKVKLVPSKELIRSGDFITVSSIPGLGQKATASGPVVGYAITNQKPGEDFVEIILQPGRYVVIENDHSTHKTPGRYSY